jgi:hypothetical protein
MVRIKRDCHPPEVLAVSAPAGAGKEKDRMRMVLEV